MRYEIKSKINLLNLNDALVVSKRVQYSHDDGRPYYRNHKEGSVMLFGEELITSKVSQDGSKRDLYCDLNDCNKLLILLDCYICNDLKSPVTFEIQGYLTVRGETKQKNGRNLLLAMGSSELYLTLFEAKCAERCIKNVLMSLARE
ncbi:hypothetical protein KOM00_19155 [Geomonas sp. Red69]|uniref:hypothetical protein n=1 Tax=Geomonas diazotrophica TaxID=2843197 RepID=UPI001C0F7570|nr:hypothetical protein [Geomonas diazotrophica]MBU5638847.1 hypothetical protein [Geomonas diazotrophica]